jgi:DNA-binding NarL/FixJ family response regulator
MPLNERGTEWTQRNGRHFLPFSGGSLLRRQVPGNNAVATNAGLKEMLPMNEATPLRCNDSRTGRLLPFESETSKGRTITVLVADDHPVVREGLISLIGRRPEIQVIAEASNGREAVEQYFARRPDVALLDLRMPIMDGIQAMAAIFEKEPEARIVILTTYQDEEDIYHALQAGVQGYLLKSASLDELVACVHAVFEGRTWIPAGVGAKLAKRVAGHALTKREIEVLRAMAAGKSNKEIGVALDISEGTVKVHMTHILEKLKATGRTEAIGVAVKRGLVRLDANPAA